MYDTRLDFLRIRETVVVAGLIYLFTHIILGDVYRGLCKVRLGEVRLGEVRLGEVRLGEVRLVEVR